MKIDPQISQIFIRTDGEAGAKRHPPDLPNPRSIFTTPQIVIAQAQIRVFL